jgi:hypothetical protein
MRDRAAVQADRDLHYEYALDHGEHGRTAQEAREYETVAELDATLAAIDREDSWPWQEIEAASESLYRELQRRVVKIMKDAGEDPDNAELFTIRCEQVAHGIAHRTRGMRS